MDVETTFLNLKARNKDPTLRPHGSSFVRVSLTNSQLRHVQLRPKTVFFLLSDSHISRKQAKHNDIYTRCKQISCKMYIFMWHISNDLLTVP